MRVSEMEKREDVCPASKAELEGWPSGEIWPGQEPRGRDGP